jgi:L-seryl-tRNA(Ser) seleniumtransferase
MILRVHPSNYRIVGFTATATLADLVKLAQAHNILLYEDLGSGALVDLTNLGLADEPIVGNSIAVGVDIVTFSGDKLLGGPQAGIIAGKSEFIGRLRKHQLYRALRVDKLTYAALEATLDAYRLDAALEKIPVLRMLSSSKKEITERVDLFAAKLRQKLGKDHDLRFDTVDGVSAIGGGAAPTVQLETKLLALTHRNMTTPRLEHALRHSSPPVITRIVEDRVMIDLRTVLENDEVEILDVLERVA